MNLLKRRRIGPAYERCPAERLTDWGHRNLLLVIATAIGAVAWWNGVTLLVMFFNWLATEGSPDKIEPYDADSPLAYGARVVGTIVVFIVMVIRSRSR